MRRVFRSLREGASRMTDGATGAGPPAAVKRRAVTISSESLVESRPLFPQGGLPLLVEPRVPGLDLAAWAAGHRSFIEEALQRDGGVLFRGFGIDAAPRL